MIFVDRIAFGGVLSLSKEIGKIRHSTVTLLLTTIAEVLTDAHIGARSTEKYTRDELDVPFRLPGAEAAVQVVQQTHGCGKQSRLHFTRQPMEEKDICHKSGIRVYICMDLRPGRVIGLIFCNRNGVRLLGRLFGSGGATRFLERRAA